MLVNTKQKRTKHSCRCIDGNPDISSLKLSTLESVEIIFYTQEDETSEPYIFMWAVFNWLGRQIVRGAPTARLMEMGAHGWKKAKNSLKQMFAKDS